MNNKLPAISLLILSLFGCDNSSDEDLTLQTLRVEGSSADELEWLPKTALEENAIFTSADFYVEAVDAGFLVFELNSERVFARAANISIDSQGYARTIEGAYLLGYLPMPGDDDVFQAGVQERINLANYVRWNVSVAGVVTGQDGDGVNKGIAKLALAHFDSYVPSRRIGNGMYALSDATRWLRYGEAQQSGGSAGIAFSTEITHPNINCARYSHFRFSGSFTIENTGAGYFAVKNDSRITFAKSLTLRVAPFSDTRLIAEDDALLANFVGSFDENTLTITGQFAETHLSYPLMWDSQVDGVGLVWGLTGISDLGEPISVSLGHIQIFAFPHPENLTEVSPGRWQSNSTSGKPMLVSGALAGYGPIVYTQGAWPLDDQCP